MSNELTLRKLKNTTFPDLYSQYMVTGKLSLGNMEKLLSIAVLLINIEDSILQHLGYRIIVDYCNNSGNYRPLYDLAINNGLYPISKFIEDHHTSEEDKNFFTFWNDASAEQYRLGTIYQTEEQKELNDFFARKSGDDVSVIAPTSYGKSELIIEAVKRYLQKKICIITSTKALLMQTKKRIIASGIVSKRKIIVHPEMYNQNEDSCIAVLTQERFQRLLKKDEQLFFDCIIVDEAHELLEDNARSMTLASVIIIAKKRNPNVVFKFLTPFISDSDNLKPRYLAYSLKTFRVHEYIKTEKYYISDVRNGTGKYYYDQYLNQFFKTDSLGTGVYEEEEVVRNTARKNLIYLNKPTDIEEFALALADQLPELSSSEIDTACKNMADYLQPQYNLISCLKKGIIYHHGSVPDTIRIFIEDLYKRLPEIKYVITSSTLLAGVNLPAERIFILDNKKGTGNLKPDAFKNLIGRVCRFSEIFSSDTGDLHMLEPEVHIIFGKYFSQNANYKRFLSSVARADLTTTDQVENVLLENTVITTENQDTLSNAQEFIENYENGTIPSYSQRYTVTEVGKAFIVNGVREIDVFLKEEEIQLLVDEYRKDAILIDNANSLMDAIRNMFIVHLRTVVNDNLRRLENKEACKFYAMMLEWRTQNKSYAETIQLFVGYWRKLVQADHNAYIYAGRWGDVDLYGSHTKPYTLLRNKNRTQIINLAIVRIKEEQDFIDNDLIRFIEVLHDLMLLDEKFYTRVKYGTDDEAIICLLKNGLSLSLATLLLETYRTFLKIDISNSTVEYDTNLLDEMTNNNENSILIYEVKSHI